MHVQFQDRTVTSPSPYADRPADRQTDRQTGRQRDRHRKIDK